MVMSKARIGKFFATAQERHEIYLRRKKDPDNPPWTRDPIFKRWRFCNVYRELDKTTMWFAAKIRHQLRRKDEVLMATVAFRWFNRISTGENLLPVLVHGWDPDLGEKILAKMDPPHFTGSYIIRSDFGMTKLHSIMKALEKVYYSRGPLVENIKACGTLEAASALLQRFHLLGTFMSYEIVSDLRHTDLLNKAEDIMTWAHPGPGAARGLGRIFHNNVDHYHYAAGGKKQQLMLEEMRKLLAMSRSHWPQGWPQWEMREVEHWLCEFDKYQRTKLGEGRPRQAFRP